MSGPVKEMEPYSTHVPLLARSIIEVFKRTSAIRVYELGVGHYSTPMINGLVRAMEGVHLAFETDGEWGQQIESQWGVNVIGVNSWVMEVPYRAGNLFFLDNNLLTKDRALLVPKLLPAGDAVVLHDASTPALSTVVKQAPFSFMDRRAMPWTAIISDKHDVASWFREE